MGTDRIHAIERERWWTFAEVKCEEFCANRSGTAAQSKDDAVNPKKNVRILRQDQDIETYTPVCLEQRTIEALQFFGWFQSVAGYSSRRC